MDSTNDWAVGYVPPQPINAYNSTYTVNASYSVNTNFSNFCAVIQNNTALASWGGDINNTPYNIYTNNLTAYKEILINNNTIIRQNTSNGRLDILDSSRNWQKVRTGWLYPSYLECNGANSSCGIGYNLNMWANSYINNAFNIWTHTQQLNVTGNAEFDGMVNITNNQGLCFYDGCINSTSTMSGISDTDLILYLPFNNNYLDYSPKHNDYTAITGTKLKLQPMVFGNGLYMYNNLTASAITYANIKTTDSNAPLELNSTTISFWLKSEGPSESYNTILAYYNSSSTNGGGFRVVVGPGGLLYTRIDTISSLNIAVPASGSRVINVSDKKPHFITFVYNTTENKAYSYIDNKNVNTINLTGKVQATNGIWTIGFGSGSSVTTANYTFDEVKVWNRALSEEEIKNIYQSKQEMITPQTFVRNNETYVQATNVTVTGRLLITRHPNVDTGSGNLADVWIYEDSNQNTQGLRIEKFLNSSTSGSTTALYVRNRHYGSSSSMDVRNAQFLTTLSRPTPTTNKAKFYNLWLQMENPAMNVNDTGVGFDFKQIFMQWDNHTSTDWRNASSITLTGLNTGYIPSNISNQNANFTYHAIYVPEGNSTFMGNIYLNNSMFVNNGSINITEGNISISSKGSAILNLYADTDNVNEKDQPYIQFFQDGGIVNGKIGYLDESNSLGIKGIATTEYLMFGTANRNDGLRINQTSKYTRVTINNLGTTSEYEFLVNGSTYLNGTLTVNSNLTLNGNLILNSTATLTGDINNYPNNLTTNIIYANYTFSQPITGSIGSGIIEADEFTSRALLNVSYSGLNVSYPRFTVRLVKTNLSSKICNIPAGSIVVQDDAHTVYYVDFNCQIQNIPMVDYVDTDLSPGGQADFFNVLAHSGNIEVIKGVSMQQKVEIKLRQLTLRTDHLRVISGMNLINDGARNLTITEGEYQYLREILDTSTQNTSKGDIIEWVYHNGVGTWGYTDGYDLNVSTCDTGTGISACSLASKYRRHFIFIIGYNNSIDDTEIHQLLPLQSISYNTLATCLDTITYPLSYTLPEEYQYTAVMVYAYCGRATDTVLVPNQAIDLREVKSGTSTSSFDPTNYYTKAETNTTIANYSGNINNTDSNITTNQIELAIINPRILLKNTENITYNDNKVHQVYFKDTNTTVGVGMIKLAEIISNNTQNATGASFSGRLYLGLYNNTHGGRYVDFSIQLTEDANASQNMSLIQTKIGDVTYIDQLVTYRWHQSNPEKYTIYVSKSATTTWSGWFNVQGSPNCTITVYPNMPVDRMYAPTTTATEMTTYTDIRFKANIYSNALISPLNNTYNIGTKALIYNTFFTNQEFAIWIHTQNLNVTGSVNISKNLDISGNITIGEKIIVNQTGDLGNYIGQFGGNVWINNSLYSEDIIDHTPAWEGTSEEALLELIETKSKNKDENVEIDHATLPEFTQREIITQKKVNCKYVPKTIIIENQTLDEKGEQVTMEIEVEEIVEECDQEIVNTPGRSIGATITMLVESVKALFEDNTEQDTRLQSLEEENTLLKTELCDRDKSYKFCEA